MVNHMTPDEIRAQIAALQAQLAKDHVPTLCDKCGAHLQGNPRCEHCGHFAEVSLPDEPPDIRKTNAADDPCGACGLVHPKDPAAPIKCRCLYCGQIGLVAMSTCDPQLGIGVVCRACCQGAAPRNLQQLEAEALAMNADQPQAMPWER